MAKSRKGARKGSTTLEDDVDGKRASRRNKREQPSAEEDNSDDDNTIGNSNAMKKRRAVTPGKDPDPHVPSNRKNKTQPKSTQPKSSQSTKLSALNDRSSRNDDDGELVSRSRGVGDGGTSSILGLAEEIEGDSLEVKKLKSLLRMQHEQVMEARYNGSIEKQTRSKEKIRYNKKRNIGKFDPLGQQMVNQFVDGCFMVSKFLPPNFHRYTTKRKSACRMIMSSIEARLGSGQGYYGNHDAQRYWEEYICPSLMYRWGQKTNQKLQKMRTSVRGELACLRPYFPRYSIHLIYTPPCLIVTIRPSSFLTESLINSKKDLMDPKELEELVKPGQDLGPQGTVWEVMTEDEFKTRYAEWYNKVALMMADQRLVGTMMIKGDSGPHDVLDTSDEALACLQYIGNFDKWKEVVEHEGEYSHDSQKFVNRGGKYCNAKGKGRFKSGISEEGRELYDNALRFFEALRDMPMFHVIEQECKRNWINSAAYKSAKSSGRYSGKKSLKSSGEVDEELVCDDEVGDVDERFVRSFYNEDEYDEEEDDNLGEDAGNMSEGGSGGDSDDGSGSDDD